MTTVVVRLSNIQPGSAALGLVKTYFLTSGRPAVTVRYQCPPSLDRISVECALSPDYLTLLRSGASVVEEIEHSGARGLRAGCVEITMEVDSHGIWETAVQACIGHARIFRVVSSTKEFEIRLNVFGGRARRAKRRPDALRR